MKTMKKLEEVVRVKEDDVKGKLANGWAFCPKSEWKKNHKTVKAEVKEVVAEEDDFGIKKQKKFKNKKTKKEVADKVEVKESAPAPKELTALDILNEGIK